MKLKRLLTVCLAMAMIFALAVPAFAADSGADAEPNGGTYCPYCGYEYHTSSNPYVLDIPTASVSVGACSHWSASHTHTYYTRYYSACHCTGNAFSTIKNLVYCPYYGFL